MCVVIFVVDCPFDLAVLCNSCVTSWCLVGNVSSQCVFLYHRYVQSLEQSLNGIQALLHPISSVSVEQERRFQREVSVVSVTPEETVSYGDIWGESDSIFVDPNTEHVGEAYDTVRCRAPSLGQHFPRIHEQSIRGDLLSVSAIDITFNSDEETSDKRK
jgi:hypothetical protein